MHRPPLYLGYPFDAAGGTFTAPNGKTYDLAKDKTVLADDAAVYWVNAMTDAVKAADPGARVDASVFTYHAVRRQGPGDFRPGAAPWCDRYPFRPTAIARSKADIVDIHLYPKDQTELSGHLESVEFETLRQAAGKEGKVLPLGEFGVCKTDERKADVESAARWAKELAGRAAGLGFQGWLYWQYDTREQPQLWSATEGNGRIFRALAETKEPGEGWDHKVQTPKER